MSFSIATKIEAFLAMEKHGRGENVEMKLDVDIFWDEQSDIELDFGSTSWGWWKLRSLGLSNRMHIGLLIRFCRVLRISKPDLYQMGPGTQLVLCVTTRSRSGAPKYRPWALVQSGAQRFEEGCF